MHTLQYYEVTSRASHRSPYEASELATPVEHALFDIAYEATLRPVFKARLMRAPI